MGKKGEAGGECCVCGGMWVGGLEGVFVLLFNVVTDIRIVTRSGVMRPSVSCTKAPHALALKNVGISNIRKCRSCILANVSNLAIKRRVRIPNSTVAGTIGHC